MIMRRMTITTINFVFDIVAYYDTTASSSTSKLRALPNKNSATTTRHEFCKHLYKKKNLRNYSTKSTAEATKRRSRIHVLASSN
eukprot:1909450-Amphidinium_carterae.1